MQSVFNHFFIIPETLPYMYQQPCLRQRKETIDFVYKSYAISYILFCVTKLVQLYWNTSSRSRIQSFNKWELVHDKYHA